MKKVIENNHEWVFKYTDMCLKKLAERNKDCILCQQILSHTEVLREQVRLLLDQQKYVNKINPTGSNRLWS